jgi:hypothetical protein
MASDGQVEKLRCHSVCPPITGSPFILFATPQRGYACLNPYEEGKKEIG